MLVQGSRLGEIHIFRRRQPIPRRYVAVCSGILDSVNKLSMATLLDSLEVFLQVNGTSRRADHLAVCGFQTNLWMTTLYLSHACLKVAAAMPGQEALGDIGSIIYYIIMQCKLSRVQLTAVPTATSPWYHKLQTGCVCLINSFQRISLITPRETSNTGTTVTIKYTSLEAIGVQGI